MLASNLLTMKTKTSVGKGRESERRHLDGATRAAKDATLWRSGDHCFYGWPTCNFFPRQLQYGIPPVPLALYYLAPSNHYAFVVNCKYSLKSGLITSECSICLCSVVPAVAVLGLRHFSWLPAICPRDGPHGRLVSDINKSTVHWHINLSASICLLS